MLHSIQADVQSILRSRHVVIDLNEHALVSADRSGFRRAISNLVTNAVVHTGRSVGDPIILAVVTTDPEWKI
jgi:signal transduction histidine kinase